MIGMQYEFTLPADYEMQRVRDRIADKGPAFDDYPGLIIKAWALADCARGSRTNRYAPIYIWSGADVALAFLKGEVFAAVCNAFGVPRLSVGLVSHAAGIKMAADITSLTRRYVNFSSLTDLRMPAASYSDASLEWVEPQVPQATLISFDAPSRDSSEVTFEVGYISKGSDWKFARI